MAFSLKNPTCLGRPTGVGRPRWGMSTDGRCECLCRPPPTAVKEATFRMDLRTSSHGSTYFDCLKDPDPQKLRVWFGASVTPVIEDSTPYP